MDCSIVGPLKLPSVTCGEFFFFFFVILFSFFLTSKQGTKAKSCFHLRTRAQPLIRTGILQTHTHLCLNTNAHWHANICICTHSHKACRIKPNWRKTTDRFFLGGKGRPLIGLQGCIKLHLHNVVSMDKQNISLISVRREDRSAWGLECSQWPRPVSSSHF